MVVGRGEMDEGRVWFIIPGELEKYAIYKKYSVPNNKWGDDKRFNNNDERNRNGPTTIIMSVPRTSLLRQKVDKKEHHFPVIKFLVRSFRAGHLIPKRQNLWMLL